MGLGSSAVVVAAVILFAGQADSRPGQLVQLSGAGACISQLDTTGLCARAKGLNAPDALAVSPDGRSIYVSSFGVSDEVAGNTGAVATLTRRADGRIMQPAGTAGCIGAVETGCSSGRALDGASGVAISPDGRHVYVSALISGAVAGFARRAAGGLSQLGCVSEGGAEGCTAGKALEQPTDLAVSADGHNVYVASFGSRAVAAFARGADGRLSQLAGAGGCIGQSDEGGVTAGCAPGHGLTGPNSLALSADGQSAYVLSDDGLATFRRAASGVLSQVGCLTADGSNGACAAYPPLLAAIDLAVSPDGTSVYVTTYSPGAILVFRRNAATGALTPLAPVTAGVALTGVADVAVSPDGTNVYAASPFSDAVLAFARGRNGSLTQLADEAACVGDAEAGTGCAAGEVLTRASSVAISPDGRHVYVASVQAVGPSCACGEELGSLSVFTRQPTVGARPSVDAGPIRAGRPFTVRAGLPEASWSCTARIGNSAVRTSSSRAGGRAICSGTVPKRTAGKRLVVVYRDRLAPGRTFTVAFRIR